MSITKFRSRQNHSSYAVTHWVQVENHKKETKKERKQKKQP